VRLQELLQLEGQGVDVVIAAGNGSAHLPGMIVSLTAIPVIGIPLCSNFQDGNGFFTLHDTNAAQVIPVGTMGINSSSVGIFACQILSQK
jgi:5-(carboxyamino)imidazole ribonucleotide mutase